MKGLNACASFFLNLCPQVHDFEVEKAFEVPQCYEITLCKNGFTL